MTTEIQRWCQPHWDRLCEQIHARGMGAFINVGGERAARETVRMLKGDHVDACGFDPLLRAWNMINLSALERHFPLTHCPLCFVAEHNFSCTEKHCTWPTAEAWMDDCLDHLRAYMIELSLIPGPGKEVA